MISWFTRRDKPATDSVVCIEVKDHPVASIKKLHVGLFGEEYFLLDGHPGIYRRNYGGNGTLAWYRGELIGFSRHRHGEESIIEFAKLLESQKREAMGSIQPC